MDAQIWKCDYQIERVFELGEWGKCSQSSFPAVRGPEYTIEQHSKKGGGVGMANKAAVMSVQNSKT